MMYTNDGSEWDEEKKSASNHAEDNDEPMNQAQSNSSWFPRAKSEKNAHIHIEFSSHSLSLIDLI